MSRKKPSSRLQLGLLGLGIVLSLVSWLEPRALAEEDPFGPPTPRAAPAGVDAGAPQTISPSEARDVVPTSGCPNLSERVCQKANTSLLAMCGGYVLACFLLGLLMNSWWSRRGTSQPWVRFLVPLLVFSIVGGLLVGFDPLQSTNLKCCLGSATFRAVIFLGDSAPARAVVLGALPIACLYAVFVVVIGAVQRRRLARG